MLNMETFRELTVDELDDVVGGEFSSPFLPFFTPQNERGPDGIADRRGLDGIADRAIRPM